MKNKKIIFFDGDGTLWYPKSTKRTKKPHWIYEENKLEKDYLKHLILTSSAVQTLKKLKQQGYILVAISTHPHKLREANLLMKNKMAHLKIDSLLDYIYTSRPIASGKGEVIVRILKKLKLRKSEALIIGDSYKFDYMSARHVGVDALLIEAVYNKDYRLRYNPRTIKKLKDLLGLLKLS